MCLAGILPDADIDHCFVLGGHVQAKESAFARVYKKALKMNKIEGKVNVCDIRVCVVLHDTCVGRVVLCIHLLMRRGTHSAST